jgi:hypothetical protein
VRLEGLGPLTKSTSSGLESTTFRLVNIPVIDGKYLKPDCQQNIRRMATVIGSSKKKSKERWKMNVTKLTKQGTEKERKTERRKERKKSTICNERKYMKVAAIPL